MSLILLFHCHLRKHLHNLRILNDEPICRLCLDAADSVSHLIFGTKTHYMMIAKSQPPKLVGNIPRNWRSVKMPFPLPPFLVCTPFESFSYTTPSPTPRSPYNQLRLSLTLAARKVWEMPGSLQNCNELNPSGY